MKQVGTKKRPGASSGPLSKVIGRSDQTRLLEGGVGAVLVDGLECPAGKRQANPAVLLRDPDTLGLKVRSHLAFDDFGDVTTDTALFLGET